MEANNQLQTTELKTPFLAILKAGNNLQIATRLADFKQNGEIDFKQVLSIEGGQRIPALIQQKGGRETVLLALSLSLKNAMNNLNLKYQMNENQVVALADTIIDQAGQDHLALEDVMLFLQKLLAGEYGPVEFKMDSPTFFKYFEAYREERFEAYEKIKYEKHVNYKSMGAERDDPETWGDLVNIARKNAGK